MESFTERAKGFWADAARSPFNLRLSVPRSMYARVMARLLLGSLYTLIAVHIRLFKYSCRLWTPQSDYDVVSGEGMNLVQQSEMTGAVRERARTAWMALTLAPGMGPIRIAK